MKIVLRIIFYGLAAVGWGFAAFTFIKALWLGAEISNPFVLLMGFFAATGAALEQSIRAAGGKICIQEEPR